MEKSFKEDFPQASKKEVYLDSAASTLKPLCVIESINEYYTSNVSNIHRANHPLSNKNVEAFEKVRQKVKGFIKASSEDEIIFTKNATEAFNLLSYSLEDSFNEGDEIILSYLEHHSNILPWQRLAMKKKLKIHYLHFDEKGFLKKEDLLKKINKKTKLISLSLCSNVTGVFQDLKSLFQLAKKQNEKILCVIDAAQSINSQKTNVRDLNCDFLAFSGHKLFAADGVGVLYGKKEKLEVLKEFLLGGGMIEDVSDESFKTLRGAHRFEAGTPSLSSVLSLGVAIDYINLKSMDAMIEYKKQINQKFMEMFSAKPLMNHFFLHPEKTCIFPFELKGTHYSDVESLLGQQAIFIRSGHHCSKLLMNQLKINGLNRVSFSIHNDIKDLEKLLKAINKIKEMIS